MEREIAETKNDDTGGLEPVSLVLPGSAEYVMLARLVAGQVGRLAGFEPEDIYDLKLAVLVADRKAVPDLPGTVGEPDVRMQDRRDPIVVVGEGAEEGAGQLGAASDEPLRSPCGGEHHQSPVRFHLQFGPVPVP